MYLSESLQKKWEGVLEHPDLPAIKDPYRKAVTAVVLENQAVEMQKSAGMLYETAPTNSMGSTVGGFQGG
ncbi:MAG: ATP-binding protein, partial [Micrococcales bacterium]|nr:ATP-binding protein [Micrococcales bacterium]